MEMTVIFGAAGAVIVFLGLLFSRSLALQRFAVMELILAVTVTVTAAWGFCRAQNFAAVHYLKLFGVYLSQASPYLAQLEDREPSAAERAAEEERLRALLYGILPVSADEKKTPGYLNAAVLVRTENGYDTWLSLGDRNFCSGGEISALVQKLADEAALHRTCAFDVPEKRGEKGYPLTGLLALTAPEKIAPQKLLLTEISLKPLWGELDSLLDGYLRFAAAALLLGTVFLMTVTALQGAELSKMTRMMLRVGEGAAEWKRPHTYSREMNLMWNSLGELVKDVAGINYERYRMLQAYYRFAPRQIERLLDKNSILEVKAGDCKWVEGILAVAELPGRSSAKTETDVQENSAAFAVLEKVGREHDGILLSAGGDLCVLTFLFRDSARKAADFGIAAAHALRETGGGRSMVPPVLLHEASFWYGVAGNEEQARTFFVSGEQRLWREFRDRLCGMGIRLAVTGNVYERLPGKTPARYIGYAELGETRFPLYEIPDAWPAGERKALMDSSEKFQEGLELFYRDDYYLARTAFTAVLKLCPFDEAARWYIFACERGLNRDGKENIFHGFLQDF